MNNVETLSNIVGIIANGAEAFRKVGTAKNPGTRLISISGHIARPGVYEIEVGYPWRQFIYEDCGGIPGGRALKAVIPGGISTKVLTGDEIETLRLDNQEVEAAGSSLGSGGMIVIAEGTCMVRLLQVMLRFYHHESCGQCTPCREGMGWLHRIIDRDRRRGEGRAGGHRPSVSDLGVERRNDDLRHGRCRRLCDERHPEQVPRRVRVLHREQTLAIRRKSGMPQIFINGQPIQAERDQTVMEAALANGIVIPYFCWHPELSVAGNCRICAIQIEDRSWVEIACNMPVSEGLARAHRLRQGEGVSQVDPAADDAQPSGRLRHLRQGGRVHAAGLPLQVQRRAVVVARSQGPTPPSSTPLSERIVLDNERCILCSRCVRFTREISKSNALGIIQRGDASLVRAAEDRPLDADPYSDNVIDICPVGALLSRSFLYKARVWYLEPTPSVCPGCARGCTVQIWHRKPEWKLNALDPRKNVSIERVTPLENPAVNGPWICNKGRDLAQIFERPACGTGDAGRAAGRAVGGDRQPRGG